MMDALGIGSGMLIEQAFFVILLIGLPIISLVDLAKKKPGATPLAVWALVICAVPVPGLLAYWIVRPGAEVKI